VSVAHYLKRLHNLAYGLGWLNRLCVVLFHTKKIPLFPLGPKSGVSQRWWPFEEL
jgi:hypothetical protein